MRNVVEYIIAAKDTTSAAITTATGRLQDFGKAIFSNLANIKAGFDMARGAISTAANAISETVREAFKFETTTVQFSVLMGSMTKARERMKELAKFATETPFELAGITKASRTLHVFTEGAMGDAESLRMVGDAAAAVGQPLEDLSFWIGRAYSMIKGGQPFGEAAMRLQEMGIMTPAARQQMESLQAAGASTSEVWGVLVKRMSEFNGGMMTLSKTGEGLTSTLNDTITEAKRTFGQEFLDSAKVAIDGITKYLQGLIDDGSIKQWAQKSLEYIYMVAGAVKAIWQGGDERQQALGALKDVVVGAFEIAAQKALNLLIEHGPKVGLAIGRAIFDVIKKPLKGNVDHAQYVQAAMETGVLDASKNGDIAKSMLHQDWWTVPEEKKAAFKNRAQELIDEKYLKENKQKEVDLPFARLEKGLSTLSSLSSKIKNSVGTNAKEIQELLEGTAAKTTTKEIKMPKKVQEDLAKADIELKKKRFEEEEKKRMEMEKKLSDEREKLMTKELGDRIAANKTELSQLEKDRTQMQNRLSAAQAQVQKAWGWYRDKGSMKKQMDEEKEQAKAEVQFEKDLDRLSRRKGDWRTAKGLSVDDEATRRLGLAKEEERNAQKALTQIEENTRDLSEKLDELLSMKGGG